MGDAKLINIKPIDARSANIICKRNHYSGRCAPNSQLHFGVFYKGSCDGVLQFGPSIDKRRMHKTLKVGFNEFLELNRMAFSDKLPRNSESRAIGICVKIIKKNYPHIRSIVSFSDACQCGDGIIYRASGFKLLSIKRNTSLLKLSDSAKKEISRFMSVNEDNIIARKSLDDKMSGGVYLSSIARKFGAKPLVGYQLKYVYLLDKKLESEFNFIPFEKIPDEARMYKGKKAQQA